MACFDFSIEFEFSKQFGCVQKNYLKIKMESALVYELSHKADLRHHSP